MLPWSSSLPRGDPVTLALVASAARALSRDSLSSATSLCTFIAAAVDVGTGTVCPASTTTDQLSNRSLTRASSPCANKTPTPNTQHPTPNACPQHHNTRANMSTPRSGRAGDRRSSRGNTHPRSTGGRNRGNGAPADNNMGRPTQQVYARGGGSRGANRGGAAHGNTTTTATPHSSADTRDRFTGPTPSSFGGLNSTPFAQDDYAKRLEYVSGTGLVGSRCC